MKPYYQDSHSKVYCGDCRDILPEISGVDMVLTDPPYFVPANSYTGKRGEGYNRKMLGDVSILGMAFELVFTHYVNRATTDNATYYVFCDPQSYPSVWATLYPMCYRVSALVWDKVVSYNGFTWRRQHEFIAWGTKGGPSKIPTGDGDVLRCRAVKYDDRGHPAQKPVELLQKLIVKHNPELVLDPFCGSGSSLVAAKSAGFNCVGIEVEEKYCEVAAKRLEDAPAGNQGAAPVQRLTAAGQNTGNALELDL